MVSACCDAFNDQALTTYATKPPCSLLTIPDISFAHAHLLLLTTVINILTVFVVFATTTTPQDGPEPHKCHSL
jgi:hypothetical protein